MKNRAGKRRKTHLALKSHVKLLFSIVFILLIILALVFISPFFVEGPTVSHEGLKNYIEEYLSEYRQFVDDNYALLAGNQSNFQFYIRYPNNIDGVISQTHGVAIFFNYSTNVGNQIKIQETKDPIEYYIWPSMPRNTSDLKWVLVKHGDYHLDSQVSYYYGLFYVEPGANLRYTGQGHAFNISGLGAIIIFGSLIEEDRMILKGTNNKEDWSKGQARFDALSDFVWDCKGILNDTTIEGIEGKYKLAFLLDKIASRIQSGTYKDDPNLFTADYEDLRSIGATNETLSKVLNDYIDMKEKPPPSWIDLAWIFFLDHIIGGMLFGAIIGGIIAAVLLRKFKSKETEPTRQSSSNKKMKRAVTPSHSASLSFARLTSNIRLLGNINS